MNAGQYSKYTPKLNLSLKRFLLGLNRDVDVLKSDVQYVRDFWFYYGRSHEPNSPTLTQLELAILYMEDRRFFQHCGVEIVSFPRAVKRRLKGRPWGGVSTIDQQVVRISTGRHQRQFSRKFLELFLALVVNFHLSKRDLMYYYMHEAYMGYRLVGCEVSSQHIFRKPAANLGYEEANFLACLYALPLPRVVFCYLDCESESVDRSPSGILAVARQLSPRWAGRFGYRYEIAMGRQGFMPKSL